MTSTMLCCLASACIRCTIGPSSGSAVSYHLGSCSAQKYGPWKISCRHVTCAPSAAALPIRSTCLSTASSLDMFAWAWMTAARTVVIRSAPPSAPGTERRHHVPGEVLDDPGGPGILLHGIDVELGHAETLELAQ